MYTNIEVLTNLWRETLGTSRLTDESKIYEYKLLKMSNVFISEYCDESDLYSIDQHKFIHVGHSGKGRSKREVRQHTNGYDPNGHTRKAVQKLVNNKQKQTQNR